MPRFAWRRGKEAGLALLMRRKEVCAELGIGDKILRVRIAEGRIHRTPLRGKYLREEVEKLKVVVGGATHGSPVREKREEE